MDTQFENSFAYRITVAEIAVLGGPDSMDDPGRPTLSFKPASQSLNSSERSKMFMYYIVSEWILACNLQGRLEILF